MEKNSLINIDREYFINSPVFLNYKTRFDLLSLKRIRYLKSVYINERIAEIPFAIKNICSLSTDKKILDLGCSESVLPIQIAVLGYQVTGFDYREYPYYHPNLTFQQGDILNLPFEDESFDAALCVSTIEHIGIGYYHDPATGKAADQEAVRQVRRALKKDGMFILTVPYGVSELKYNHRIYNQDSLGQILSGFKVEEQQYYKIGWNDKSRSNYWQETSPNEAAQVRSGESAHCVSLVRAIKQ